MNIPNRLTIFRILIIPIIVILYYVQPNQDDYDFFNAMIGGLFILGAITDFFDGYLARQRNQITNFGKFLDPIADKMLVITALLLLVESGIVPMWIIIIILTRDFLVNGVRLLAAGEGHILAAGMLGKIKTTVTMIALGLLLFYGVHDIILTIGIILIYTGVALTIVSGMEYLYKNKKVILQSK